MKPRPGLSSRSITGTLQRLNWRSITDFVKHNDSALRLVDKMGRGRGRLRWLDHLSVPPPAPLRPDLLRWQEQDLAAAWIGHATVLLRLGGMTILTDPVLSNRVGIGFGLVTGGPRRYVAPALSLHELPLVDLILISHAHYDHLDCPTLARLSKNTPVITASGTADLLRDLGYHRIVELRWGESARSNGATITAQRVMHWGARTFFDSHRGYNAYLLQAGHRRILYGGDSAFGSHFKPIGKVDLAVLGIGAYDPYVAAHATPEQAWQMADDLRADHLLPMHHSTFKLSHEPMHEPIQRLLDRAGRNMDRVVIQQVGGQWAAN